MSPAQAAQSVGVSRPTVSQHRGSERENVLSQYEAQVSLDGRQRREKSTVGQQTSNAGFLLIGRLIQTKIINQATQKVLAFQPVFFLNYL